MNPVGIGRAGRREVDQGGGVLEPHLRHHTVRRLFDPSTVQQHRPQRCYRVRPVRRRDRFQRSRRRPALANSTIDTLFAIGAALLLQPASLAHRATMPGLRPVDSHRHAAVTRLGDGLALSGTCAEVSAVDVVGAGGYGAVMARTVLPAPEPLGPLGIVELVGRHTTLRPGGQGRLWGACPFCGLRCGEGGDGRAFTAKIHCDR